MLIQIEKSRNSGSPIELYKFHSDSFTTPYYFTSTVESQSYLGNTYVPVAGLKRSTIEMAKGAEANTITVEMDGNNDLAKKYLKYLPPKAVWVTIYRKHLLDTDNEVVIFWQGRVSGVTHGAQMATFNCEPMITALSKQGLEYTFGNTCQNMLYDSGCKVNINDYTFNAPIIGINGNTITSPTFSIFPTTLTAVPDGYWVTGFVTKSNGDIKHIVSHTGSNIELLTPFEDLVVGETLTVSAGCNHSMTSCVGKFTNVINFLAFPFTSDNKNPFTTRIDQ